MTILRRSLRAGQGGALLVLLAACAGPQAVMALAPGVIPVRLRVIELPGDARPAAAKPPRTELEPLSRQIESWR